MARRQDKCSSPAPFLLKTYEMLNDASTDEIVSWTHSGSSFVVWNPIAFSQNVLPKFFKHNNFSSFVRQLNTYGFRKIDPDQWEFANADFVEGQRHKIDRIHRRKPIHSRSNGGEYPVTAEERLRFMRKIESLEAEKNLLIMKLEASERKKEEFGQQVEALDYRLYGIEATQTRLVSLLDQRPGQTALKQHEGKKRKVVEGGKGVKEEQKGLVCNERVEKIEVALGLWEGFFQAESDNFMETSAESSSSQQMSSLFSPEIGRGSVMAGLSDCDDEIARINDQFWQHFLTEESSDDMY